MKINIRTVHRDFGYFYMGLIISFALSGIMQNHRKSWHPEKYTVETKNISITLPANEKEITEEYSKALGAKLGIKDNFRRLNLKEGKLKLSFEKTDIEVDTKSGKGEIVTFKKTPLISQVIKLHKDNSSNWWIYYSDIFGISLIIIAITGSLMIPKGNFNFKNRGFKLAIAGILFPLVFLFILS